MFMRRLSWQLYLTCLALVLAVLACVSWYSVSSFKKFYLAETKGDLHTRALILTHDFDEIIEASNFAAADSLCKFYGKISSARITIVLPSGKVIGDSDSDPADMENHRDRPEVYMVLSGAPMGERQRFSSTMHARMLYVAVPLHAHKAIAGVLRLSLPIPAIDDLLRRYYSRIFGASLIAIALAALAGLWISRRISRPLEQMKEGALRFASGDLSHAIAVPDGEEMGSLATTLNSMARQLHDRITAMTRQHAEREAILSSMTEGVIALDNRERILLLNKAAAAFIGADSASVQGRWINEVVRNSALEKFAARALASEETIEAGIVIAGGDSDRFIQAHGTALRDSEQHTIGALLVLNDITEIKRVESLRRDFVANASHELRTPLTAIKGFVETLQSGAYSGEEEHKRFLSIIAAKVDRLCTLVDDLLMLSMLEKEGTDELVLEEVPLEGVVRAAVEACASRAEDRSITVRIACDPDIRARVNPSLAEQALINLIDNAVKYSSEGQTVVVECRHEEAGVFLSVRDQGIGIEAEHIGRLFERFYRVDKARSRKLGGSGLGLAIVKNIAAAHGGHVAVESTPGKGSAFSIHFPAA